MYLGPPVIWQSAPDIIGAHKLIRASGVPNFLGQRIPVKSDLNISSWRQHLCNYFDQQMVDLIQYGFPLDFDRNLDLFSTFKNHVSAVEFASHVDKYIAEESHHGALLGPLDHPPLNIHISPFMTRPKSGFEVRRTIVDLSWPKGHSVNDGVSNSTYLGTPFSLRYSSVDSIIRTLNQIGPGASIFKVDISHAFCHVPIDPGDIDLLGLQHRDKLYLDLKTPFGYRLGSNFFQKISDSIRFIMNKNGHTGLRNYIDDLIYIGLPSVIRTPYDFLLSLLQDLGLQVSSKKLCPPSTKVTCLGIEFDTEKCIMSIPSSKLHEIVHMCFQWSDKRVASKQELQSFLGPLLYITKCVSSSRVFLNHMLQLLRDNAHNDMIVLNQHFHKDLKWVNVFLQSYNGVTMYHVALFRNRCIWMHLFKALRAL